MTSWRGVPSPKERASVLLPEAWAYPAVAVARYSRGDPAQRWRSPLLDTTPSASGTST